MQILLFFSFKGVATLLLTNPFMVAKTRLCLQYENMASAASISTGNSTYYNGMVDCLRKTFRKEGFGGLYKVNELLFSLCI